MFPRAYAVKGDVVEKNVIDPLIKRLKQYISPFERYV